MTRSLVTSGRGVAWIFLVPVVVVLSIAVDTSVTGNGRDRESQELMANAAIFVLCVVLWYFPIGRIPNRAFVKNVRQQVADEALVFGADVMTGPHRSARVIARFNGTIPNVFVASETGVQLWAGKGDSARPVATWRWTAIGGIDMLDREASSLIALTPEGSSMPYLPVPLREPIVLDPQDPGESARSRRRSAGGPPRGRHPQSERSGPRRPLVDRVIVSLRPRR